MTKTKLNLDLAGKDGNAFALLGHFAHEAWQAGWTKEEIKAVYDEATNGDYSHLLATLMDV